MASKKSLINALLTLSKRVEYLEDNSLLKLEKDWSMVTVTSFFKPNATFTIIPYIQKLVVHFGTYFNNYGPLININTGPTDETGYINFWYINTGSPKETYSSFTIPKWLYDLWRKKQPEIWK